MAELLIAFLVNACRIVEEALVSIEVGGVELGDLAGQRGSVVRIVEAGAVGPAESIEGHDRIERHIVSHVAP